MCILVPIKVPKALAHVAENDHLINLDGFGPFDLTLHGAFQMAMKRGFVRVALILCIDAFRIFIILHSRTYGSFASAVDRMKSIASL